MKTITMLDLRKDTASIINGLARGGRFILTYRGKALARIEPIVDSNDADDEDPIFSLRQSAKASPLGKLDHRKIDEQIYG